LKILEAMPRIKKKDTLVVLDIDSTLMDSTSRRIPKRKSDSIYFGYYSYKRPFLTEFILECFRTFKHVAIWTAGTKDWADNFLNNVIGMKRSDFLFVWDVSQCSTTKDLYYCKPLRKIWSVTKYKGMFNSKNTLILDDRLANGMFNRNNFILIPPYTLKDPIDNTLAQLIVYLRLYDWENHDFKKLVKGIKLSKHIE